MKPFAVALAVPVVFVGLAIASIGVLACAAGLALAWAGAAAGEFFYRRMHGCGWPGLRTDVEALQSRNGPISGEPETRRSDHTSNLLPFPPSLRG